jgi:hypothetical protein
VGVILKIRLSGGVVPGDEGVLEGPGHLAEQVRDPGLPSGPVAEA